MDSLFDNPSLTFAIAMAVGMFAQLLARHVMMPGIVLLLALGVGLGPDGANVVRPEALGQAMGAIVSFSVAVILFEGGLNLRLKVLRAQAKPIRRLVTVGALVTAVGGALAARALMGWDWRLSILFGTLVIVTGPTVITPLVRRIRLKPNVGTILEAEGVFIDAIGATIAAVALEVAIAPTSQAVGAGFLSIAARLGVGTVIGLAGGAALAGLLRARRLVPAGLENVLALAMAVALFELSEAIVHESGIPAAIVAGMVVGNARSHALSEIAEFKEQLTVLLIGTLFVLLAADVRIAEVAALGRWGGLTVLALMLVVRPATVLLSTAGTDLSWRDKLFLSWLAPRGIVAAAIASLFASELDHFGIEGGTQLKALVFLVIAVTVTVQGLTGGVVARALGVQRTKNSGYVLLGANPLAIRIAGILRDAGEAVWLIDTNAEDCRSAEKAGFRVLQGNGIEERTLLRARADSRAVAVGLTPNESVNLLFARQVLEHFRGPEVFIALESAGRGVTAEMVEELGAHVLFGGTRDLDLWIHRARHRHVEVLQVEAIELTEGEERTPMSEAAPGLLLPILERRRDGRRGLADVPRGRSGDRVDLLVPADRRDDAVAWLERGGWRPVARDEAAASRA